MDADYLEQQLGLLTGETVPYPERLKVVKVSVGSGEHGLGYSQLNELLLLAGLDRITHSFFAYLLTGSPDYKPGMAFESKSQLTEGVDRFRKTALLSYGNVKFAFKSLSRDEELLRSDLAGIEELNSETFEKRHVPLLSVEPISPEDSYLTGYIVGQALDERLKRAEVDEADRLLDKKRSTVIAKAARNQAAYLASDHLDVYIATSMREKHEFISIERTIKQIFENESVSALNLRWFDPTIAYCPNRIDKGLAEALMLRRASCTIYLAQESDTLGKDSELASTLAQGKPVIAFVPEVNAAFLTEHFAALRRADPAKSEVYHLLNQLRLFEPTAAWDDPVVRGWCENPGSAPIDRIKDRVDQKIKSHYDRRAHLLMEKHPLGIQVNLATGVANGVMVVRSAADCAMLVRGVVTRTLQFNLEEAEGCTVLRERISGCIFRVMSKDAMLTNTFWNFYLNPAE